MNAINKILALVLSLLMMKTYTCKTEDKKLISFVKINDSLSKNYAQNEKTELKYNDKGVCILMYHSIGYEKNNGLRIPVQQFKQQMKYINNNGYITLTLQQLYNFFMKNIPVPKKSVVITFDDGYLDNYENAYPILKEYNIKATIFVIPNIVDKKRAYMTSNQLKQLQNNGIDIESHTYNHEVLNNLSYKEQVFTLEKSKESLEKMLNNKVNYVAYPLGKINQSTIRAAKDAGYTMAFVTGGKIARKSDGIYTLHRIGVVAIDGIDVLAGRLENQ